MKTGKLLRRAIAIERASAKEADEDDVSASTLDSLGWVYSDVASTKSTRPHRKSYHPLRRVVDAVLLDHLGDVYIKLGLAEKAATRGKTPLNKSITIPAPRKKNANPKSRRKSNRYREGVSPRRVLHLMLASRRYSQHSGHFTHAIPSEVRGKRPDYRISLFASWANLIFCFFYPLSELNSPLTCKRISCWKLIGLPRLIERYDTAFTAKAKLNP